MLLSGALSHRKISSSTGTKKAMSEQVAVQPSRMVGEIRLVSFTTTQEIEAIIAVVDCPHHQQGQVKSAR
jgi:hypothetical protein